MTLIGINKTFETQRNRGRGGARISADQKGKKSEPTEDAEEHGAVNSGGFPISAMFGNSGDSGNSTDPAACIEIKKTAETETGNENRNRR